MSPEKKVNLKQTCDETTHRRGRPRITGQRLKEKQAAILAVAGRLLALYPSKDISVELLLQESGASRPTFYRWFPQGLEQVFDMLIQNANADLALRLISAIALHDEIPDRIKAGVRAYFDWGIEQGSVVVGIYREGFTEGSIAQRYRKQAIDQVIGLIYQHIAEKDLSPLSPRVIETLVSWVESAGVIVFRDYPIRSEEVAKQCELTIRMLLSILESTDLLTA